MTPTETKMVATLTMRIYRLETAMHDIANYYYPKDFAYRTAMDALKATEK